MVSTTGFERRPGLGARGWIHSFLPGLDVHRHVRRRRPAAAVGDDSSERRLPGGPYDLDHVDSDSLGRNRATRYKFYRYDQSVGWVVMRDWNQSNQASWTPGASNVGEHSLQVWVRTVGSNVLYEDWKGTGSFLIATPEVSLTPDRPLTDLHLNDAITWTASVSGAVGPWEYKFIAFDGTTWRVLQDYSTQTTFTWFPPAHTCALQVWVRAIGSSASWEVYQSSGLFDVSP